MGALLIASLLVAGGALAAQGRQTTPGSPLVLEIGIRGYLAGGQMSSSAGDSATDKLESYVWADQTLCGMGASDDAPRTTPAFGWHFTGEVVSQSPGQLTVRLQWQRLWDKGTRLQSSVGGGRQVTLRSGERIELDRVSASEAGRCGMVEARLEAAVGPRAAYLMSGGRGGGFASAGRGGRGSIEPSGRGSGAGSGTGSGSGGASGSAPTTAARGGRGSAAGGGTFNRPTVSGEPGAARGGRGGAAGGGTTNATGRGGGSSVSGSGTSGETRPQVAQAGRGGGGGGRGGSVSGTYSYLGATYDAEVWLVHKQPGGAEVVQQQTLRFGPGARDFAFPPIQVNSRGGTITLDITGRLGGASRDYVIYTARAGRGSQPAQQGGQVQQGQERQRVGIGPADPSQAQMFVVSIARRVRRTTPFLDTRGATDVSIEIPKPNDVLDFELPPLQRETEDLLKGHTFSIRLRVTPVK